MLCRSLIATVLVATVAFPAAAQSPASPVAAMPAGPLAPFERLIGGQWHLDDGYHEFEWGVDRKSVIARSFFLIEGKPVLVSEGLWYWHPGERAIRGVVTATGMPVELFLYTTRFEGDMMVSELDCYDSAGNASAYVETFQFVDDSHYEWTLYSETGAGRKKAMGGTYTRHRAH